MVKCEVCQERLKPAPANWDGQCTFVGMLPCPDHPNAGVVFSDKEDGTKREIINELERVSWKVGGNANAYPISWLDELKSNLS